MNNNPISHSRRKILTRATLSGVVFSVSQSAPETWIKPVINSVLLPAHAQTSQNEIIQSSSDDSQVNSYSAVMRQTISNQASVPADRTATQRLQDLFIPVANAVSINPPPSEGKAIETEEVYLSQIADELYDFVYVYTDVYASGAGVFSFILKGELRPGIPVTLERLACGKTAGSSEVVLTKIIPGISAHVDVNSGKRPIDLGFAPAASPPSVNTCIRPPLQG